DAAAGAGDDRDLARKVGHVRENMSACLRLPCPGVRHEMGGGGCTNGNDALAGPGGAMCRCQTPFGSRTTLVTASCSLFVRLEEARRRDSQPRFDVRLDTLQRFRWGVARADPLHELPLLRIVLR